MLKNIIHEDAREEGFTLIELLVVILIIGILSAIAVPAFMNQRKAAVDSSLQSDIRQLKIELETWSVKNPMESVPSMALRPVGDPNPNGTHNAAGLSFHPSPGNYIRVFRQTHNGDKGYCISAWNEGSTQYQTEANPMQYSTHRGIVGGSCTLPL